MSMDQFEIIIQELRKNKTACDLSQDIQLQQENITALQSGTLLEIQKQYDKSIAKYRDEINALSGVTNIGLVRKTLSMPDDIRDSLAYITNMIPAYVACRELNCEAKDRILHLLLPYFNSPK